MFQMHQLPGVPWQGQVRRSESPNAEGKCRSTYQRLPAILSMQSIPKKEGCGGPSYQNWVDRWAPSSFSDLVGNASAVRTSTI